MKETRLSLRHLALIGATRGMLGAGIGLLLASRLARRHRLAAGWTLLAIGALSTIPLGITVARRRTESTNGHAKKTPTEAVMSD
jgi:hypothetical protein